MEERDIQPPYRAAGVNGVIELYGEYLKILRPGGCLSPFPKGEKMIPFATLTAVQYRPADKISGFIQLIFAGSQEGKGGTWQAAKDENTVLFTIKEQYHFEHVRDFLHARIGRSPHAESTVTDWAGEIERLGHLRDRGLVTAEEFEEKKKRLLGL